MRQMLSEDDDANRGLMVGPHPNLEDMIQKAGWDDNLFIGSLKN
jgi:hypothetical protein